MDEPTQASEQVKRAIEVRYEQSQLLKKLKTTKDDIIPQINLPEDIEENVLQQIDTKIQDTKHNLQACEEIFNRHSEDFMKLSKMFQTKRRYNGVLTQRLSKKLFMDGYLVYLKFITVLHQAKCAYCKRPLEYDIELCIPVNKSTPKTWSHNPFYHKKENEKLDTIEHLEYIQAEANDVRPVHFICHQILQHPHYNPSNDPSRHPRVLPYKPENNHHICIVQRNLSHVLLNRTQKEPGLINLDYLRLLLQFKCKVKNSFYSLIWRNGNYSDVFIQTNWTMY